MITVGQVGMMLALFGQRWREARRRVLVRRFDQRRVVRLARGARADHRVTPRMIAAVAAELKDLDRSRTVRRFRDPGGRHRR